MTVDLEKLRGLSPGLGKFLEFEREIEQSMSQEERERAEGYYEEKRLREKRARKKRLKKLRQTQQE